MTQLHSSLPAWQTVDAHAREIGGAHLRDLDAADPKRWQNLHLEHGDWLLDFSRQRVTGKTLALLTEHGRWHVPQAHRAAHHWTASSVRQNTSDTVVRPFPSPDAQRH